jgi:hypothetical protein
MIKIGWKVVQIYLCKQLLFFNAHKNMDEKVFVWECWCVKCDIGWKNKCWAAYKWENPYTLYLNILSEDVMSNLTWVVTLNSIGWSVLV